MKKILLSYDKRNHDTALKMINSDVGILNSFVTTITENTTKIEISKENIESLIKDAKGFIFDMIVDKSSMNFNGVPISRKKAMELVEYPKEFEAVMSKAESVKESLRGSCYTVNGQANVDKITIQDLDLIDNTFQLTEKYLMDLKDEFSSFTRNEGQNTAIECLENIFNSISTLKKVGFTTDRKLENGNIRDLGFKFYDSKLLIDIEQVKRIR